MFKGWVILIAIAIGYCAHAQSIRGKVIYISSQPVKFKFGSRISDYGFTERALASQFKVDVSKKNLSVSNIGGEFKSVNLVVSEGANAHLFILYYSKNTGAGEEIYDFSTPELLKAETEVITKGGGDKAEPPVQITAAINKPVENVKAEDAVQQQRVDAHAAGAKPDVENTVAENISKISKPKPNGTIILMNEKPAKPQQRKDSIIYISSKSSNPSKALPSFEDHYNQLIHLGDSTAWIANDLQGSLRWYDSARKLSPFASYPLKQVNAVRAALREQAEAAKAERSKRFASALADYKTADALRVERKFGDAYKAYSKFLSQLDSAAEYKSSELYYINQAKDYLVRLQPYLPKPKAEPIPVQGPIKTKNKKRKAAGH